MQNAENRQRAQLMLRCLMAPLTSPDAPGWRLRLFLGGQVAFRWPRPDSGLIPAQVVVERGMVPIGELISKAASSGHREAQRFGKLLEHCPVEEGSADVVALLHFAWESSEELGLSLLQQLLRALGFALDARVMATATGGDELAPGFSITAEGIDCTNMYRLDSILKQYVDGTTALFADARFHSVCADKSRVGGQALQNGAIVLPNNTGARMVPQASRGARASPVGSSGPHLSGRLPRSLSSVESISFPPGEIRPHRILLLNLIYTDDWWAEKSRGKTLPECESGLSVPLPSV